MSDGAYAGLRLAKRAGNPAPHDSDDETKETPLPGEEKDDEMTDEEHQAALAEANAKARAEGFTAANARFAAVTSSEEFPGREALAHQLLGNAALSAEDIIGSLKVAEKKPAAAAAELSEDDKRAAAKEAGRKEMQAALGDNANSGIDASGGKGPDKAASSASVWDKAIASVFPTSKAK